MIIDGKDFRVIIGAIMIFLHIPFNQVKKRKLSKSEVKSLDNLCDKLMDLADHEYGKIDDPNDSEEVKIDKRLAISAEFNFTEQEFSLSKEVLKYYVELADIWEDKNSLNVYFNGTQYRVDYEDFKKLLKRFEEEG